MNDDNWIRIVIATLLLLGATIGSVVPAKSHSWYDSDCCSAADCEPVQSVTFVAADGQSRPVMVVTTSLGTKPLTPQTKIRDSKDNRMHGCIYGGNLICIYLPPGG